jgi:hypothetical protein|nr:MAG TPA: hypothetical protein [Caudoviricetes sp.]
MKKDNNKSTTEKYKILISEILNRSDKEEIEVKEKNDITKTVDEISKKWKMNERIIELFANNIEQDQKLRSRYAKILIRILSVELIALILIFVLKGLGKLNYSDSTFNIFISGGIAEIFVLVRLIVKYLFKDNLTEALKIIITMNNKRIIKNQSKKENKTSDKR